MKLQVQVCPQRHPSLPSNVSLWLPWQHLRNRCAWSLQKISPHDLLRRLLASTFCPGPNTSRGAASQDGDGLTDGFRKQVSECSAAMPLRHARCGANFTVFVPLVCVGKQCEEEGLQRPRVRHKAFDEDHRQNDPRTVPHRAPLGGTGAATLDGV